MIESPRPRGHDAATNPLTPPAPSHAPWTPDRGDGTYKNPVLFADYSDPDAICVGEDYWMTSSSFCHVPGLPILHSRDLVNWSLVNHALPRLTPVAHFSQPRHGEGVWAPSLRHHAGKFWIFYPDPDFGIYVITAVDPRGAWSEPVLIKSGKGLIDPCPLWDDDGQAYLIHGWAKSRAGICNRLTVHRIDPATARIQDAGTFVIDGDLIPGGWHTIEGPKLHKRNGWYFVFAPAGGVAVGYQAVFRSRNIFGPYESRIVLEQGASAVNGPHQGAWVETPAGEHWFFHFQEMPAYGRVVHLQPMSWRDDDWPAMGVNRDAAGKGEPAPVHAKPSLPVQAVATPATSDDFSAPALGHQWQWQGNVSPDVYSLAANPGALRLYCVPARGVSHWNSETLLMQKFPAPAFTATTTLTFAPTEEGDTAGLIVFGYDYAWLGLRQTREGSKLILANCQSARDGAPEAVAATFAVSTKSIHLRVRVDSEACCHFSWSADGQHFEPIGATFPAVSSKWVGAKVGLFASTASTSGKAHGDFGSFRVAP